MDIEYTGARLEGIDPRAELLLKFVCEYDATLLKLVEALSDESKQTLIKYPNPNLAIGSADAYMCADGAVVLFKNLFPPNPDCSASKGKAAMFAKVSAAEFVACSWIDVLTRIETRLPSDKLRG